MSKTANQVKSRKKTKWNYEQTVSNLEIIVQQIESGDLTLEEVFDKFAWAVAALQECEDFLSQKTSQMNLLIETLEDESDF